MLSCIWLPPFGLRTQATRESYKRFVWPPSLVFPDFSLAMAIMSTTAPPTSTTTSTNLWASFGRLAKTDKRYEIVVAKNPDRKRDGNCLVGVDLLQISSSATGGQELKRTYRSRPERDSVVALETSDALRVKPSDYQILALRQGGTGFTEGSQTASMFRLLSAIGDHFAVDPEMFLQEATS